MPFIPCTEIIAPSCHTGINAESGLPRNCGTILLSLDNLHVKWIDFKHFEFNKNSLSLILHTVIPHTIITRPNKYIHHRIKIIFFYSVTCTSYYILYYMPLMSEWVMLQECVTMRQFARQTSVDLLRVWVPSGYKATNMHACTPDLYYMYM